MILSLFLTIAGSAAMTITILGWYMRDNSYNDNILIQLRWPATILLCAYTLLFVFGMLLSSVRTKQPQARGSYHKPVDLPAPDEMQGISTDWAHPDTLLTYQDQDTLRITFTGKHR